MSWPPRHSRNGNLRITMEHGDARDNGDPLFSQINKRNILPVSMLTRTSADNFSLGLQVSVCNPGSREIPQQATRGSAGWLRGKGSEGRAQDLVATSSQREKREREMIGGENPRCKFCSVFYCLSFFGTIKPSLSS